MAKDTRAQCELVEALCSIWGLKKTVAEEETMHVTEATKGNWCEIYYYGCKKNLAPKSN